MSRLARSSRRPNPAAVRPRRWTRQDYHKMAAAGILNEDSRVELLEGEVVEMAPIGPGHNRSTAFLSRTVIRTIGDRGIVYTQSSFAIGPDSEPEPDLLVLRPAEHEYAESLPTPEDVLLLVEVSETTLEEDLGRKLQLYARGGVREYWVVDRPGRRLLVHTKPRKPRGSSPAGYGHTVILTPPATASPAALPDLRIDLTDLFAR